jgi:hypothetical protein
MANKTEVLRDVSQTTGRFHVKFRTPSQRHNQICNGAQQGGFPNPRGAEDDHDFPRTNRETDRVRKRLIIPDNEVGKGEEFSFQGTLSTPNEREHLFKFSLP